LKKKADDYFKSNHLEKTGNWKLFSKTFKSIPLAFGLFFSLLYFFQELHIWALLFMNSLLGLKLASKGFNIMHDACHGVYSNKQWVNDLMGYSLNIMGGNQFIWKQKHNIIHHI